MYAHRAVERCQYARGLLALGFDFQVDEYLPRSRDLQPWPQTQAELDEVWCKRVRGEWLSLKLAGKDNTTIVTTLDKRYERAIKRMGQATRADAFQTFMNAYNMTIEPHTNYLGPASRSKQLHVGYRIVGVGQGALGEMINVIGWRGEDLMPLIRGPIGTVLKLAVLPADVGPVKDRSG